jgi:hypothetical protein
VTVDHVILIAAGVWVVLSVLAFYAFMGLNAWAKRTTRRRAGERPGTRAAD